MGFAARNTDCRVARQLNRCGRARPTVRETAMASAGSVKHLQFLWEIRQPEGSLQSANFLAARVSPLRAFGGSIAADLLRQLANLEPVHLELQRAERNAQRPGGRGDV